ncbi:MAG: hypothetical protein HYY50_02175 [Candidatus Kerfeldbacteria bacterium]|nr:hypothetical protein [Candidatus Kerfeldbacteria bacterium]
MTQTGNPAATAAQPMPTVEQHMLHDHWFVQIVGGLTLANAIISSLALFWMFLEYGLPTT